MIPTHFLPYDQVLLMEERPRHGGRVAFIDRPLADDPQDQLLWPIRGAVAESERPLIAERTRRGRLHQWQTGPMLPWTRPPYGDRADPQRPREPAEAASVVDRFRWYADEDRSFLAVGQRLHDRKVQSPRGREDGGSPRSEAS